MSITPFPPRPPRMIPVEAEIPENLRAEFHQAMLEITAGRRPRLDVLEHEESAEKARAVEALQTIEKAIASSPTSGQTRRLLRFLAGVYNGQDYPFDLTELRALDQTLANACLDYLNYDRLGHTEVHTHLSGGDALLHQWLADAVIEPGLPKP